MNGSKKRKIENYLEEERRTELQLFQKKFEKIVLLNNEQFYWTKYFTKQTIMLNDSKLKNEHNKLWFLKQT